MTYMTLLLKMSEASPDIKGIRKAAAIIKEGGIVVFPTETVYGIGANAFDGNACLRIFELKGREQDNPLIVHVSSINMAEKVAVIPKMYKKILGNVWPAPLTVILKARKGIPKSVTAGLRTVAVRMPDNKIALRLIEESGTPIAAPSANISKRPSSTRASHAIKYFYGKADAIIDAGSSRFGIESTVIDLDNFELLRPGAFSVDGIEKLFGRKLKIYGTQEKRGYVAKPKSPGMKYMHYAPLTPIFLFNGDIRSIGNATKPYAGRFIFIGSDESCKIAKRYAKDTIGIGRREDVDVIAHNLFDALIRLDGKTSEFAVIECFGEEGIGLALMNRIRKACSYKSFTDADSLIKLVG
jgi:L-threonylcarbamoyladenylate synthase